uniref:Uncharacterized protein n=1 Tax=Spongospora subterranea TaxID=70186 RepID=A0A0H5QPP4_9EUKA|eukprot:CRZ03351.1 hypothetical protein [Spongospora subterranea]
MDCDSTCIGGIFHYCPRANEDITHIILLVSKAIVKPLCLAEFYLYVGAFWRPSTSDRNFSDNSMDYQWRPCFISEGDKQYPNLSWDRIAFVFPRFAIFNQEHTP